MGALGKMWAIGFRVYCIERIRSVAWSSHRMKVASETLKYYLCVCLTQTAFQRF